MPSSSAGRPWTPPRPWRTPNQSSCAWAPLMRHAGGWACRRLSRPALHAQTHRLGPSRMHADCWPAWGTGLPAGHACALECRVQGAGCRVQGAGCRVQGAGCRVQGVAQPAGPSPDREMALPQADAWHDAIARQQNVMQRLAGADDDRQPSEDTDDSLSQVGPCAAACQWWQMRQARALSRTIRKLLPRSMWGTAALQACWLRAPAILSSQTCLPGLSPAVHLACRPARPTWQGKLPPRLRAGPSRKSPWRCRPTWARLRCSWAAAPQTPGGPLRWAQLRPGMPEQRRRTGHEAEAWPNAITAHQ